MTTFNPGDRVYADTTLAEFVRIVPVSGLAIIKIGSDIRAVDPSSLRKAG